MQGVNAIAIGVSTGQTLQSSGAIAIGYLAGGTGQNRQAIAIGINAGQTTQGTSSVAIGEGAGSTGQGTNAVAIGNNAGFSSQSGAAVAIGTFSGQTNQGSATVAIGFGAGRINQTRFSIAIGNNAGYTSQSINSIAIGNLAGQSTQGNQAIAIGLNAGQFTQGQGCIAIGQNAGNTGQATNSIVLFANNNTGAFLNSPAASSFVVKPIRGSASVNTVAALVYYVAGTGEFAIGGTTTTVVSQGTKTFVIDHPHKKEHYLVHACLEGPEAGVYYRGKSEIKGKSVLINLPDYILSWFDFTMHLTPIGSFARIYYNEIGIGEFEVFADQPCKFSWVVYAKRSDIKVEPLKSETVISGEGPYRWIN